MYDYPVFEDGELKVWNEFLHGKSYKIEEIYRNGQQSIKRLEYTPTEAHQ